MFMNSEGVQWYASKSASAIQRKHCGLLSCGMCPQHDNAQPHTAAHTMKQIQDLKLEVLPHPLYSPCLASSDLHFFWPLKDATHEHNFRSNVTGWHNNQKTPFPNSLGLSGMLKVCRTWWGWHWRFMSLSLSVFTIYHFYNFSGVHFNYSCSDQWPVNIKWVRMICVWASNQAALLVWSL
jgi:hypothetical protein